jgi:hypothetical protein
MVDAYIDGAGVASQIVMATLVYAILAVVLYAVSVAIWRRL